MTRLLLDTHVLLWAAWRSPRLSQQADALIRDPENEKLFSVVSLWEIAIKLALGRSDLVLDIVALRDGLLVNAYTELPILAGHALMTARLPAIHKDPFDRLLVAQALEQKLTLLTADPVVASYSAAIMRV
jgi:PIN domain nuclease of toxin-antitoxin system